MKKELLSARDEIIATVLCIADNRLGPDTRHEVSEAIKNGFKPLLEKKRETCSIVTKQIGDVGFRVVKTTNLLDIKIGSMLTPRQAEKMRADGINFTVMRNS